VAWIIHGIFISGTFSRINFVLGLTVSEFQWNLCVIRSYENLHKQIKLQNCL